VVVTRWTDIADGKAPVNSKSVRKWARIRSSSFLPKLLEQKAGVKIEQDNPKRGKSEQEYERYKAAKTVAGRKLSPKKSTKISM
jgi:hypothetical protein